MATHTSPASAPALGSLAHISASLRSSVPCADAAVGAAGRAASVVQGELATPEAIRVRGHTAALLTAIAALLLGYIGRVVGWAEERLGLPPPPAAVPGAPVAGEGALGAEVTDVFWRVARITRTMTGAGLRRLRERAPGGTGVAEMMTKVVGYVRSAAVWAEEKLEISPPPPPGERAVGETVGVVEEVIGAEGALVVRRVWRIGTVVAGVGLEKVQKMREAKSS